MQVDDLRALVNSLRPNRFAARDNRGTSNLEISGKPEAILEIASGLFRFRSDVIQQMVSTSGGTHHVSLIVDMDVYSIFIALAIDSSWPGSTRPSRNIINDMGIAMLSKDKLLLDFEQESSLRETMASICEPDRRRRWES
jgi:hypothetical protein